MAGDGAVEVLLGGYGDGHGENREGLQANVRLRMVAVTVN